MKKFLRRSKFDVSMVTAYTWLSEDTGVQFFLIKLS